MLTPPTPQQLLDALCALARDVPIDTQERSLVERFLGVMTTLFPGRLLAVRTLDVRGNSGARVCCSGATPRVGVESDPLILKPSAVAKTNIKVAVTESAQVRVREDWDNPFATAAVGFTVPLVASGELYGAIDLGYVPGDDLIALDEPLVIPIANHLSAALRNERMRRDMSALRDYQASLIEQANALILGVGPDWRINVCNRAFCDLVGLSRSSVIGTDLREFMSGDTRVAFTNMFRRGMRNLRESNVDIRLSCRSGEKVRTVWSIAPVLSRGETRAVVGIGQDQTRIVELQNQIVQAEKLATLGQLAAGVVHELNNPLTSITVYADFLLKKAQAGAASPAGDVDKLTRIHDSAARIQAFAKDLVSYSRPSDSRVESVMISSVVKQSLLFCEHLFGGIKLEAILEDELPSVLIVPARVEQVVINLVTNAVHAIGAPQGQVSVRTFSANDRVHVCVEDTGPGIAIQDRERVFEPFYTTKSDGEGTGLGLSIVANIVDQLGGAVRVDEGASGGALFTVSFPVES